MAPVSKEKRKRDSRAIQSKQSPVFVTTHTPPRWLVSHSREKRCETHGDYSLAEDYHSSHYQQELKLEHSVHPVLPLRLPLRAAAGTATATTRPPSPQSLSAPTHSHSPTSKPLQVPAKASPFASSAAEDILMLNSGPASAGESTLRAAGLLDTASQAWSAHTGKGTDTPHRVVHHYSDMSNTRQAALSVVAACVEQAIHAVHPLLPCPSLVQPLPPSTDADVDEDAELTQTQADQADQADARCDVTDAEVDILLQAAAAYITTHTHTESNGSSSHGSGGKLPGQIKIWYVCVYLSLSLSLAVCVCVYFCRIPRHSLLTLLSRSPLLP